MNPIAFKMVSDKYNELRLRHQKTQSEKAFMAELADMINLHRQAERHNRASIAQTVRSSLK